MSRRAQGFQIVRTDPLEGDTALVTLRAPVGMSTRRALRRLREADPQGVYDFDHLHLESGPVFGAVTGGQSGVVNGPRIGLIDSGVGDSVRVSAQRAFATETPVAGPHGTAIAGLLSSAAPGARIFAADIYGGAPTGGASSALARALSWLASENVAVINVSLVGPRNRVVEAVVARLVARGFLIVAAVGNDGPAAAPLFPAAYDGVVGVTAVDARDRVLIEAGRGAQVDFAALGVQGRSRGTSYAAPLVAARLAASSPTPSPTSAQSAIAAARTQARDLGVRGRDDIYGYGLISGP
ncbi:MAG: S8 family serine peptidase [Hyphomonadaceae bacterium]